MAFVFSKSIAFKRGMEKGDLEGYEMYKFKKLVSTRIIVQQVLKESPVNTTEPYIDGTTQLNPDIPWYLGERETCGKSGSAVNQGFVYVSLLMKAKSKENNRGISRFAVNRGAVNVGLNVVSFMIINSSKRVRVDECHYSWGHEQDEFQLGDVQIALYLWHHGGEGS